MDKFAWGFGRKVQPVLEWTLKVFHDRANGTEAGLKGTMKKVGIRERPGNGTEARLKGAMK